MRTAGVAMEQAVNWFEAVVWFAMAATVLWLGLRTPAPAAPHRRLALIASPTLAIFGVSDIIEVYTGAWWSPWWLLLMKAACILILTGCVTVLVRAARTRATCNQGRPPAKPESKRTSTPAAATEADPDISYSTDVGDLKSKL